MSEGGPLRVAVDARPLDIDFLRDQGIGRYADGLLRHLPAVAAERGGEVVLLRQGPARPSVFAAAQGNGEARSATMRVRRPPVPARAADLLEQALLPLDLRRARAGLVHSLSIYRAAVRPGVPQVMTIHDLIPLMWPGEYLRTGLVHRLLYRAARRARRLIAVSERARADAVEQLGVEPERITVVHEAADERFCPTEPGGLPARLGIPGRYLLCVGGLANQDPRKGVATLVEEFASWAAAEGRTETLVLAGRLGPASERLREQARRAGAPVLFAGFVPESDLPALYSGAAAMVTASRYEGFCLPALEALACGTPVVGYDAGAIGEIAGPGALLVPPGELGELGELFRAAASLCDEPALREQLAARGRAHAARFSWREAAERTWDVYEQAAF